MQIYTKKSLIEKLLTIAESGWIPNARAGNHGGIGNTLEDLLGIEENNLPIPNAAEWELKTHKLGSTALTTLFHTEPSPTALSLVSNVLLPLYGWPHAEAGKKYKETELSFRQTIHGLSRSDRGFMVQIDTTERKISISFDSSSVAVRHALWLDSVKKRVGLHELDPQPYWGFDDLRNKAGTKLHNCFFVEARSKIVKKKEYFQI